MARDALPPPGTLPRGDYNYNNDDSDEDDSDDDDDEEDDDDSDVGGGVASLGKASSYVIEGDEVVAVVSSDRAALSKERGGTLDGAARSLKYEKVRMGGRRG